ncbi:RDD family protein [Thioploca ingrica]|uniref:RDD family protein n=1 Tax=Thioploca ingrica TaxID=40754 RepID=A0A090AIF6_9GAMM|nr:RDD family protein [Thioploca ingrica]
MLDTTRSIETPEGIELSLRVAGPVIRALAWSIDLGIRSIMYSLLALFLSYLGKLGHGIFFIAIFVLEWFYPIVFEVYRQGATPGKRAFKIKVLHEWGTPVNWSAAMIRNLLRFVDFLPFFYGFGLVTMLINKDFKRIGDLAAGTIVVYDDEKMKPITLPGELARAMPVSLPLEEQLAIISFAERAPQFPPARKLELANLVTALTNTSDEVGVKTLYQLANGLMGVNDQIANQESHYERHSTTKASI